MDVRTDGQTDGQTDGRRTDFDTKLIYPFFLKKKAGIKMIFHTLRKRIRYLGEQFFSFKDIYSCPIEIIKGLTDKGQFHYLTKLRAPQDRTYR